ncbi:MAG: FAD:protein FMN transferase [Candidatus Levyibacteriota bacterium]
MKKHAVIMGMPVTVEIVDDAEEKDVEEIFSYLHYIDDVFSTYKKTSEIEKINRGELAQKDASEEVKKVFSLAEKTAKETSGYFTVHIHNKLDPSGIVKGYAIYESANILSKKGYKNFYVAIAGDMEIRGYNTEKKKWRVGIENPFDRKEIVKVVYLSDRGIATSGNYIRGQHIYDPIHKKNADEIASISVIGPNVYEADRFATAAFAMGEKGIAFIETLKNFEGYMIRKDKQALFTSGFQNYTIEI